MAPRVPSGELGPGWPDEPDDGQGYGDQRAQHNGYGPNGYNGPNGYHGNGHGAPSQDQQQHQYGRYGGPGRSAPAGYGQHQPYGGQSGDGYGQPGYQPGLGQGHDNGRNGGPRGYPDEREQENIRRCEGLQRFEDQRHQMPGPGPGGPALPGRPSQDVPPARKRKVRFRRTRRLFRYRFVRAISVVVALPRAGDL